MGTRDDRHQGLAEGLMLRALTYFGDAERKACPQGEGADDWQGVKAFFLSRVGNLLVHPSGKLEIQGHIVDVR